MNKIFYSAYTCKDNLGDLVITKTQIEEYSKYGEVYVDFTGMPIDFKNIILDKKNKNIKDFTVEYGKSYRGKQFLSIIKFLHKEDFTHFTKSPGPYAVLSLPLKKLIVRLMGAIGYFYAHKLGLKVFALGIDLDYIRQTKWLQYINTRYFSVYNLLGLRSIPNVTLYESQLHNIKYVPDMAILYNPVNYVTKKRKKIALSFRKVNEKDLLVADLKNLLSMFVTHGYDIDIVYQVEEDKYFSKELYSCLSNNGINMVHECIRYNNLSIYSQYDYVFSNRLHVLLLAAKYGVIPFALISEDIKEQKIANIFFSIGIERLSGYIGSAKDHQWTSLLQDKTSYQRIVTESFEYQRQLCKREIAFFFKEYK